MADQPSAPAPQPPVPERPVRVLALFTARELKLGEIPRLIEFCSQAYAEDQPGASLRLAAEQPGGNIFRLEAVPGTLLKESEIILRVHTMDDPKSDHPAIIQHFEKLDPEIGALARNSLEGAVTYVALVGSRLREQNRINAFLNAGALIGSALGALFMDPAAVIVTPDPGEWADACEQSLQIEGAMASMAKP